MEAWETSGLPRLPFSQQRLLERDLIQGAKEAEMWDITGAAGGQSAALVDSIKPAGEVLLDMVKETRHYLIDVLQNTVSVEE